MVVVDSVVAEEEEDVLEEELLLEELEEELLLEELEEELLEPLVVSSPVLSQPTKTRTVRIIATTIMRAKNFFMIKVLLL